MPMFRHFKAQRAGKKAGRQWRNILHHTASDIEDLTGKDAYRHACDQARKWLYSTHQEGYLKVQEMEERHHDEFLAYVERFLAELAPEFEHPKW